MGRSLWGRKVHMDLGFLSEYFVLVIVGIPTICAILGMILAIWLNGWTVTPAVILSGMFSGLASTGLHQMFIQYIDKNSK